MSVPAIALYVSPPRGICSTPHHSCQIPHDPSDFDLNPRPSSSAASSSSSAKKSIIGGLSRLYSSPATRHAGSSSSSFTGTDELGSLWHDRSEDLSNSFYYASYPRRPSSAPGSSAGTRAPCWCSRGLVSCSGSGSA